MIGPDNLEAVTQRITEDPAILSLGDLDLKRAACRPRKTGLLLEDRAAAILYVVELQLGPTDDRQVIRLVESWAAERKRHDSRRCFAVLLAEQMEPRYQNILAAIGGAVPVIAMEMQVGKDDVRFTPVALR